MNKIIFGVNMENLTVLSVGGSIIAPDKVDYDFLRNFYKAVKQYLDEDKTRKLIIVTGGGAPARIYQEAYRKVVDNPSSSEQDWLGIQATHLNGRLLCAIFAEYCTDPLVKNPTDDIAFSSQMLIAGGWKPGFSTDTDAVYLAEKFGSKTIVNLSNIEKVYTDDPKTNPEAVPLDTITWTDFRTMVGDTWIPGKNTPFDPVASKEAEKESMKVICANGRDIENTMAILEGRKFIGTTIG